MANLATGKQYANAARKLHNFLHSSGKTLPVKITAAEITIRRMKKTGGEILVSHPIILLTSWMKCALELGGKFLLGGWTTLQAAEYQDMFNRFWARYAHVDASHPVFSKTASERCRTIPICAHGDEGRGVAKLPVLVAAYQPVIPWSGENCLNSKGFMARLSGKVFELLIWVVVKICVCVCLIHIS